MHYAAAAVMEAHDHRGGGAAAGDPLHHVGGRTMPLSQAAHLTCAHQAQQPGRPQGIKGRAGGAAGAIRSARGGRDHRAYDRVQAVQV